MRRLIFVSTFISFCLFFSVGAVVAQAKKIQQNEIKQAQVFRFIKSVRSQMFGEPNSFRPAKVGKQANFSSGAVSSIAGTVSGLDETAITSAYVEAFTTDSLPASGVSYKGLAVVNPDGSYQIDSLTVGNYYVIAWADGYYLKYYNNVYDFEAATTVPVRAGAVTGSIDFNMEKIMPGTGSIAGSVIRQSDNAPITAATVVATSTEFPFLYGWAETAEDGSYRIKELKSGLYYVAVWIDEYLAEFYDNAMSLEEADLVEVVEPHETAAINFALVKGGSISGQVTDSDNNPLAGAFIEAIAEKLDSTGIGDWDPSGRPLSGYGSAMSGEDGRYIITGLPTDDYYLHVYYWTDWLFVEEWYENAASLADAQVVPVLAGTAVSDIDFQLQVELPNGVIAGRVTDDQDLPIPDAYVYVQPVGNSPLNPWFWVYAVTDKSGNYRLQNLPDGSYYVSAYAQSGWQFVQLWWQEAESLEQATTISILNGSEVYAIDFKLPITMGTASIAGSIVASDGRALAGVSISLSSTDSLFPDGNKRFDIWAWATSDSNGYYWIDRLPAGSYLAQATYWENDSYAQQWFDQADDITNATAIILANGEKRSDINFSLTLKPVYGKIVGAVMDSLTGMPINRAYVEITPLFNQSYWNFCPMYWYANYAITDENGKYQVDYLWEGEYLVSVYANGAFEYFENVSVADLATPIKVTGGASAEVNFYLKPRNEGPGVLSGKVVSDWENLPFDIAVVTAQPTADGVLPQSKLFYTAVTDVNGFYEMAGLPVGSYLVKSFAPWTIGEYFDNVFDPAEAMVVNVDGFNATTGIDFSLSPMWFLKGGELYDRGANSGGIVGTVTDSNGAPLNEATIYIFNESEQVVGFARSGADGSYQLRGLPPGNYVLQASFFGYESQYNGNVDNFSEVVPVQLGSGLVEVNFSLVSSSATGVKKAETSSLPKTVQLYGNYPNPFNPETKISFALPRTMKVKLTVFNIFGEQVATLIDGELAAGLFDAVWNSRQQFSGSLVASGVYFYRLQAEQETVSGKMLLIR